MTPRPTTLTPRGERLVDALAVLGGVVVFIAVILACFIPAYLVGGAR